MKEIINLLKEKIEFQKAFIDRIERNYENLRKAPDGQEHELNEILLDSLNYKRNKQQDVLNNLRNALASMRKANGEKFYEFNICEPEK